MPKARTRDQKSYSYGVVRSAIKHGRLIRPSICGACRKKPKATTDGRSPIHAHHKDHSKPLAVEWICSKCHRKETPLPCGERSSTAKLTVKQVRFIRRSKLTTSQLAKKYGVYIGTIQRVLNGRYWKCVPLQAAKPAPTKEPV